MNKTYFLLPPSSQQPIVPKLLKTVIASLIYCFLLGLYMQIHFGKWLYQSQVAKFPEGSSVVGEGTRKKKKKSLCFH